MKTIIINIIGVALIIWAAFIAVNVALYLIYVAIILSLFYPVTALIIIASLTLGLSFWLGTAFRRPKSYRLRG